MLTPQEVNEKRFDKAVFGGYDMAGVDQFLETVTQDYATLYRDNTLLKNKLKVLVETVEEYRSVDESMRKALLAAQKMADEMVQNARRESENLVSSARISAEREVHELRAQVDAERAQLVEAQNSTQEFLDAMRLLCERQLKALSQLPNISAPPPPTPQQKQTELTAEDIEHTLQEKLGEDLDELPFSAASEPREPTLDREAPPPQVQSFEVTTEGGLSQQPPAPDRATEDTVAPRPRFDFTDLQFGEEYDLTVR